MHQLDFCVTVHCGSFEALHKIEQMLSLKGAGVLFLGHTLFNIVDRSYRGELSGFEVEIHSLDINEDTKDETVYICRTCSVLHNVPICTGVKIRKSLCGRCGRGLSVYSIVEEENVTGDRSCSQCGWLPCQCGDDSFGDGEERLTFTKHPTNRYMRLDVAAPGSLFETETGVRAVKTELREKFGVHDRWKCVEIGTGLIWWLRDETKIKVLICEEDEIPF